jgi:hypothetical protein
MGVLGIVVVEEVAGHSRRRILTGDRLEADGGGAVLPRALLFSARHGKGRALARGMPPRPRGGAIRRLTRVERALALIAVVDAGEFTWDVAHGSPGTHWLLKLTVLVLALTGILGVEAFRHLRAR